MGVGMGREGDSEAVVIGGQFSFDEHNSRHVKRHCCPPAEGAGRGPPSDGVRPPGRQYRRC